MKKICGMIVLILTLGLIWSDGSVLAQSDVGKIETTNFVKASGIITDVAKKEGIVTLTVETIGKEPLITFYNLTNETLIYNSGSTEKMKKTDIQKGQQIDTYYDKDKPMIMIYPAQISPELVIVNDAKTPGSVKVGKFDEELLSLDNELNLKVNNKTVLENTKGDRIDKTELNGKELLVFYTIATKSIPAQTSPTKIVAIPSLNVEDTSNYAKYSGVITEITNDTDQLALTVVTEEDEPITTIFTFDEKVLFFKGTKSESVKKESFQIGQKVEAYYDKNKPRILIYPARITPELIVIPSEEEFSFVKVAKFDQNLLSLDHELQLSISEETKMLNEKGEVVTQKDIEGKELVVFYSFTKRGMEGIPDQTTPSKIIAISYISLDLKKIIENDHFIQNGTKMIPLRKVAEQLGYEVKSYTTPKQRLVELTKGNSSIKVFRDTKAYSYNKSLQLFSEKPVLKDKKTYVPEEILEIIK